jgi:hypothetical protein
MQSWVENSTNGARSARKAKQDPDESIFIKVFVRPTDHGG